MQYGVTLNAMAEQYVVLLTYDNRPDFKAIHGGVYKVKANALKERDRLNALTAAEIERYEDADAAWLEERRHRVYKVAKLVYKEVRNEM